MRRTPQPCEKNYVAARRKSHIEMPSGAAAKAASAPLSLHRLSHRPAFYCWSAN